MDSPDKLAKSRADAPILSLRAMFVVVLVIAIVFVSVRIAASIQWTTPTHYQLMKCLNRAIYECHCWDPDCPHEGTTLQELLGSLRSVWSDYRTGLQFLEHHPEMVSEVHWLPGKRIDRQAGKDIILVVRFTDSDVVLVATWDGWVKSFPYATPANELVGQNLDDVHRKLYGP